MPRDNRKAKLAIEGSRDFDFSRVDKSDVEEFIQEYYPYQWMDSVLLLQTLWQAHPQLQYEVYL